MTERERIVAFIREEAATQSALRRAAKAGTDRIYRSGQADALLLIADAIERGLDR